MPALTPRTLMARGTLTDPRAPTRQRPSHLSARLIVALVALVLLALAAIPGLTFASRSASARATIETAAGLTAIVFAVLAMGRFRRTGLRGDLLVAISLGLLGGSSVLFSLIPTVAESHPGSFSTWSPAAARLVAGVLWLGAAWAPEVRVRRIGRSERRAYAAGVAALALIAVLAWALAGDLPGTANPAVSPLAHGQGLGSAPLLTVLVRVASLLVYGLAAAGFVRRFAGSREWFDAGLMAGAVLLACAWVNYLRFPTFHPEWVTTGDALRLGAYIAFFIGAIGEIDSQQRAAARGAVLLERRRISRELHDGLAQELAYIVGQAKRLDRRNPDAGLFSLVRATENALDESRNAISSFRAPLDESLPTSLARVAAETAHRFGLSIEVSVDETIDAPASTRGTLLRITREALTNTGRHAAAQSATVELLDEGRLVLRVRDDGAGFEPGDAPAGFGLTGMRERVVALGGILEVRSAPGQGTEVEVTFP
jgi:signal transduction histidine kinase